jgi:hypothetical protein
MIGDGAVANQGPASGVAGSSGLDEMDALIDRVLNHNGIGNLGYTAASYYLG